jgi:hypothetical protein
MFEAVYVFLGAVLFRLRGAEIFYRVTGRGKTTADAAWAVLLAVPTLGVVRWEASVAFAVAFWLGARLGWWKSLTLGRNESDGPAWAQYARHTARGVLWTLPAALVAYAFGMSPIPLLVAGACCTVAYEAGWRLSDVLHWRIGGTEWGEIFFGALIALAIVLTI